MSNKKQPNFNRLKILTITLLALAVVFLLEPSFRNKLTFAVTYFDNPKVSSGQIKAHYVAEPASQQPVRQKSHAPEPSTLFLILSGIGGMVIRFAQKSFTKFKRAMDYFLAILGLAIVSPILLFAGIMIKLNSPGPVIYRQKRVGKRGKIFRIYKLRTMSIDAERFTGAVWAKENDPRITSVGKVLRKLHIDEIPQLLNVIKGEMSIVGPRPERPEMVRDLKEAIIDYEKRLIVKPGITGLAQVYHKYDETIADVRKKIKYDLLYIKKMCWLLEMRILAQTFIVALTGRGAR
jgi:lipopolysaccharide/colanic/teichoic acid biosynthesis glycosyltransferase